MGRVKPLRRRCRVCPKNVPVFDLATRPKADDQIRAITSFKITRQEQLAVSSDFRLPNMPQEQQTLPQYPLTILGELINMGRTYMRNAES
jgi:hypothetical protein